MTDAAAGVPVVLHVGTPKSGTTFIQRVLARHRDLLDTENVIYPGSRPSHFLEALDLRGDAASRGRASDAAGTWDSLVAEVADRPDQLVVVSHEMFGGAGRGRVRAAVEAFGGRPVEVVITCRDLGRQLPAVWQESVKNGATSSFAEMLAETLGSWEGPTSRRGWWAGQNLAGVAGRWADAVGSERVSLVTVPAEASPEVLWRRFADAAHLPSLDYALPERPRNESLGVAETEVLRLLTARMPADLAPGDRARLLKRGAARHLAGGAVSGPITVPEAWRGRVRDVAAEQRESLAAAGYHVIGDPDDLVPWFREGREPTSQEILEAALELSRMLLVDQGGPQSSTTSEIV